jgi:hypothetical protein
MLVFVSSPTVWTDFKGAHNFWTDGRCELPARGEALFGSEQWQELNGFASLKTFTRRGEYAHLTNISNYDRRI